MGTIVADAWGGPEGFFRELNRSEPQLGKELCNFMSSGPESIHPHGPVVLEVGRLLEMLWFLLPSRDWPGLPSVVASPMGRWAAECPTEMSLHHGTSFNGAFQMAYLHATNDFIDLASLAPLSWSQFRALFHGSWWQGSSLAFSLHRHRVVDLGLNIRCAATVMLPSMGVDLGLALTDDEGERISRALEWGPLDSWGSRVVGQTLLITMMALGNPLDRNAMEDFLAGLRASESPHNPGRWASWFFAGHPRLDALDELRRRAEGIPLALAMPLNLEAVAEDLGPVPRDFHRGMDGEFSLVKGGLNR